MLDTPFNKSVMGRGLLPIVPFNVVYLWPENGQISNSL